MEIMGRKEQKQRFKEELAAEMQKGRTSKYYIERRGDHIFYDFDIAAMVSDYSKAFPSIRKDRIVGHVENAVADHFR